VRNQNRFISLVCVLAIPIIVACSSRLDLGSASQHIEWQSPPDANVDATASNANTDAQPPTATTDVACDTCNTDVDVAAIDFGAYLDFYKTIQTEGSQCGCQEDGSCACGKSEVCGCSDGVNDMCMPDEEGAMLCGGDPLPPEKKVISFANYCKLRPWVHSLIVQLQAQKDMSWFKVVNGVAWVAAKIADQFGIPADYALDIANYLSGKNAVIKTVDDMIKELQQWEAAMGKDVCNPLHPENPKDDPDKGARLVGVWAACKALAAQPTIGKFTPKYCNMGSLNRDAIKDLEADCDAKCREQGGVNSTNGLTLAACKKSCMSTMRTICQIAFNIEKGTDAEPSCRWGKVQKFCDGYKPQQLH